MEFILEDKKCDVQVFLSKKSNKLLKKYGFEAKLEQSCLLPEKGELYVGIEDSESESLKIAAATAVKALRGKNIESLKIKLGDSKQSYDVALGLMLGAYEFDKYKSKKSTPIQEVVLLNADAVAVDEAMVVAESVNYTRDIINTTPDDATPKVLASLSMELAKDSLLNCVVLDEKEMEKEGMHTLLAVSRASVHKPRLIHLSHTPKNAKKKVVIVGKGLTYDSGGLSLKPSDFMNTMKSDKSGGCAAMGIIKAVNEMNLPIEVHVVVGAVENMIGGNAYKPDDVLCSKNGKTIEVKNTDAEGRLVLADCLSYAQEKVEDIDLLLDFATLTGACAVGVGEYTSGVMAHSKKVLKKLEKASTKSGEMTAHLPFNRFLKKLIKSPIADVCHIASSRYGGAITAAHFLDEFIEDNNKQKWAHIDIAGPAYVEKEWGYNPHGASGAGVQLGVAVIQNMCKKD